MAVDDDSVVEPTPAEEMPDLTNLTTDLRKAIDAVKVAAVEANISLRAAADSLSGRKPTLPNRAGRRAAKRATRKKGR